MKRRRLGPLGVWMNGRRVGRLSSETSGAIHFRYDPDWLAWEGAMPISLSLPLREDAWSGPPVLNVLDNLLPDLTEIRRHMAERIGAEGSDPFSLLAAIGRDCVGALQFLPDEEAPGPLNRIDAEPYSEDQIADLIGSLGRSPLGVTGDDDFRISLAGAQEKTAMLRRDGQWFLPHGSTPTTHILKPTIGMVDGFDLSTSVENEHLCMRLASAFGLPVAATEMATFGERRVLVVERFDRRWLPDGRLIRLPQEDFCQATSTPSARKYENKGGPGAVAVLNLLLGSDDPGRDRQTILRALIVFWLLGATDGHAKNFSLSLRPGGGYALTDLYDILSTQPLVAMGALRLAQFKMSMAIGDNRNYRIEAILPRHFEQTAAAARMPRTVVRDLFEDLADRAPKALEAVLESLPIEFPQSVAEPIAAGIHRRLSLLPSAASA